MSVVWKFNIFQKGFKLLSNIPYKSISISDFDFHHDDICYCDLSHLYHLSLVHFHAIGADDLLIFKNIQHLSLKIRPRISRIESPRIFYDTSLELTGFNLYSWTSVESIPNVKRIKLIDCIDINPTLSSLSGIVNIPIIITFPFCTHLEVSSSYALEFIAVQLLLRELKVIDCPLFCDYEIDGQLLNRVQIDICPEFLPICKFRNKRKLLYSLWSIRSSIFSKNCAINYQFISTSW